MRRWNGRINNLNTTMSDITILNDDAFKAQRNVAFFLRLHGHLPDDKCGSSFPFGPCNYRPDLEPINGSNGFVIELRKDPEYARREKEVQEAQRQGITYNK